ncbi:diguanylate cyclase (GGDEF)-like protein [Rhizobium sp. BK313]|uniref:GGDEF domain-containing protein n=1 Tax=Rhizobium sp. BK313 TaxID=2587081 RepID=UPI00105D2D1C|nr:GGDEF domain-containing protein [Rhizobium sp. BK313]MBB3453670.1 diguanylate cyclase (GGDEF)-like protein [Rhizobium sp. BK313]
MLNITTGLTIWCSEAITLATVLFFAWRHDRQTPAYLMWALGFTVSAVGFALVAARGIIPDILSIEIGNGIALLGESAWIAGFCCMDKRKPEWSALLPPVIWFAGVELPWIHESFANRVILYDLAGAVGATLLASAVRPAEGRREAVRGQLGFVFMALACVSFVSAISMTLLRPGPQDALIYRGYTALGSAFLITTAIALSGRLLMERSERRWRAISITDTLTGVLNRRGLQDYFELVAGKATKDSQKIATLLFDLDHFKAINDRYGHQTGDIVLAEFARIGRQFVPRSGAFGRMGGEEFTAFILVDDQAEAEAIAETIRADFCRVPLLAGRSLVPATVSIGLAIMPRDTANWDRLVSAADRALYAAKRAGRNCTIVFSETEAAMATDTPPDPNGGELVPTLDDQIHALRRLGTLSRM